jgi:hypothetical protein
MERLRRDGSTAEALTFRAPFDAPLVASSTP